MFVCVLSRLTVAYGGQTIRRIGFWWVRGPVSGGIRPHTPGRNRIFLAAGHDQPQGSVTGAPPSACQWHGQAALPLH